LSAHDELREQIAAYAAGRLLPEERGRIERHLSECPDCREIASTAQEITWAADARDAELFDAHPDTTVLRRFVVGGSGLHDAAIPAHLEHCDSCALEVAALRAAPTDVMAREPRARGAWLARLRPASLVAAGVVVGFLLALLYRQAAPGRSAVIAPPPSGVERPGGAAPQTVGPGAPAIPAWSDVVELAVLEDLSRGQGDVLRVPVSPGQPYVPISVALGALPSAPRPEALVFEIVESGGKVVWSSTVSVAAVEQSLRETHVVSFLVQAAPLTEGRYRLSVTEAGRAVRKPLLTSWFEITARAREGASTPDSGR